MASINLTMTISQVVKANPRLEKVFRKFNINISYAGNLSIAEVCSMTGLNMEDLVQELESVNREAKFLDEKVLAGYGIPELIGYILFTHHAYLEKELPRLEELFGEAVLEDGAEHPELLELVPLFKDFKDAMLWHMREEEKHLFPFFLLMVEGTSPSPALDEEGITNLIHLFENEDEEIQLDLDRLKSRTRGYHVPEGAGRAYRDLFHDLGLMEIELNRHVRVENQLLFPKVLAAEIAMLKREKGAVQPAMPSLP